VKAKNKPRYSIVAINVKESVDNKEIYDCTHKELSGFESRLNFDNLNLRHYSEVAVLKEKRKNTKKKNLVYTVFKYFNGDIEMLFLSEGDFVKYMTRQEFKTLTREFYDYENSLQNKSKENG